MQTIQPFIDAGWHTVPLGGELKRLADGSKTTPLFESGWRNKYTKDFNENATPLGGAITGACSNIVAIDCDDQATYDLFKALDPDCQCVFLSKDKPSGGATLIYEWDETIPSSFRLHSQLAQIDFYNNDGFVYLPTAANSTKHMLSSVPPVTKLPPLVLKLLTNFNEQYRLSRVTGTKQVDTTNYRSLRILVEALVSRRTMDRAMAPLTPKDFRELQAYKDKGWLHPTEVPDGRGSEYMSKFSAIIGADPSIDEDLYTEAIKVVNDMWVTPMPFNRLQQTIIKPMLTGQASIDGQPIWAFDPKWEDKGFSFMSKANEVYECFFDDVKIMWYALNTTSSVIKAHSTQAELTTFVDNASLLYMKKADIVRRLPLIRTIVSTVHQEGFLDGPPKQYNMFKRTKALEIIQTPSIHAAIYEPPEVTLSYLKTLIPDDDTRDYVLSWLKYKLTKFEYSPVILYLLGASGSGKDTFVNLLRQFMGPNTFAKPSPTEFVSQFNGWLESAYFVHCDEYGDQLDRNNALVAKGRIKTYTGSPSVQIRNLHSSAYETTHNATFIMTANRNPLEFDHDDRRFVYIKTPNKLDDQPWVQALGGTSVLMAKLNEEILNFAYYLATQIELLPPSDYTNPPMTEAKKDAIASSLPPLTQFALYLKSNNFVKLEMLLSNYGFSLHELADARDRIYLEQLLDVLAVMYPGKLTAAILARELDNLGVIRHRTSARREGRTVHTFYIACPGLFAFAETLDNDFTETTGTFTEVTL